MARWSKPCLVFPTGTATMKLSGDRYEWAAQENRCSPHVPIALRALLRPEGEQSFETSVIDLSSGGFAAWCGDRLPYGSVCWLTFPGPEPLRATVVWREDKFVGCAFSDLLAPAVHDSIIKRNRERYASPPA